MSSDTSMKKNELDALFMKTYVKMLNEFQKCFIKDYDEDSAWCHTINVLNKNKNDKNIIILLFK